MLPETPPAAPELERRTPGETDLRVFTDELIPAGRHRVDRSRLRSRVGRDRLTGRPMLRLAVLALAGVLVAGCSSSKSKPGEGGQSARLSASAEASLSGVCPATVVVQTSWFSQVEHFAVMRDADLVTNGRTPMVGDFDLTPGGRVDRLLKIDAPIFTAQRKQLAPNLTPDRIATNDYLSPSIGLPAGR